MKTYKQLYYIVTAALLLSGSSCERIDNGPLDGMWMMTRMDSIATDKSQQTRSLRKAWSFQANLMQMFQYPEKTDGHEWDYPLMARFDYSGATMIISDPFFYDRMNGDRHLNADSIQYLLPFGINAIPDTFQVEKLDRKKMQLSNKVVRLYFEKY